MNILTQAKTTEFIKKLQGFNSKRGTRHASLSILEPRFFDIIITQLGSKKILEMERVSDSCEQICKEHDIDYYCLYSEKFGRNRKLPAEWDGDIIVGLTSMKEARKVFMKANKILQEGHWLAIYQTYNFLESQSRFVEIFEKNPFHKMYVTPSRPLISADGEFPEKLNPIKNGAWFVWFKGQPVTHPEIEWISDELFSKYFICEYGKVVKPDKYSRMWKKPIQVEVDRGLHKSTEWMT